MMEMRFEFLEQAKDGLGRDLVMWAMLMQI